MTPTLIVLALAALGVAVVVWFTRRKPDVSPTEPLEDDTSWHDPIPPANTARPEAMADPFAHAPPPEEPRP